MRNRKGILGLHPFRLCFFKPLTDQTPPARQHLLVTSPVTRHATHLVRLRNLASEFILREKVTAVAMNARLKHRARHRLDAFAADARIQIGSRRMTLAVACVAVVRGRCDRVSRLVLDLNVAVCALDFVVGHMGLMHELGLAVAIQSRRIVMASIAPFARHFAGALNHI